MLRVQVGLSVGRVFRFPRGFCFLSYDDDSAVAPPVCRPGGACFCVVFCWGALYFTICLLFVALAGVWLVRFSGCLSLDLYEVFGLFGLVGV